MKKQRIAAMALSASLLLSANVYAFSPADFPDFPNDWSSTAMTRALENGILRGNAEGKISPNGLVTRAQMGTIVSRAFGAKDAVSLDQFTDVATDAWYYDAMSRAVAMGAFHGNDDKLNPNAAITRQEVFTILARIYSLENTDTGILDSFQDVGQISQWAKSSVAAMVENGYVLGNGIDIKPRTTITRAELAQVMDNMAASYLTGAESETVPAKGNVVLRTDMPLKNTTINGDLIIADGAAGVQLDNVTVTGRILIRGGTQGVTLVDTKAQGGVIADSPRKAASLTVQGDSTAEVLVKGNVRLSGKLDNVTVAESATVTVEKDASIKKVDIQSENVTVEGSGTVSRVQVSADGATVSTKGTQVTVDKGVHGTVAGGKDVKGGETAATRPNGNGLAGHSTPDHKPSRPDPKPDPKPDPEQPQKPDVSQGKLALTAKVVDLSWSKFLAVQFAEGQTLENTTLTVDGQDITSVCTPVTDDGSVVKWEVSSLHPGQLVLTADGKTQTVKLGNGTAQTKVHASAGTPDFFLMNGPIYVWDFHLTNYDVAGNVRVKPAKTTFDLGVDAVTSASKLGYSRDAILSQDKDAANKYGVSGQVELKFNYETDEQKAYVDGITDVDLVAYDERHNTLNGELNYDLDKNVRHGERTNAVITVPLGQTNFFANGRYYLRVTSNGKAMLFPIHVVNEVIPIMKITGDTGYSGKEVHFRIDNMTYGITSPVYRVELTNPAGKTFNLNKFDDWFLHNDLLVLYNDHTNYFPEAGTYTVKVWADGFQPFSKEFQHKGVATEGVAAPRALTVDAITSASVGGGSDGSSSSGGGTNFMNANLILDTDLLVNAEIVVELGLRDEAAAGIVNRWSTMRPLYAFNEGGEIVYTYVDYFNAVNTAETQGQYLSFADYIKSEDAVTTRNRPYSVKRVLEDNLLGETTSFSKASAKEAPELGITVEDNIITITCADEVYMTKLAEQGKLNLNGRSLQGGKFTVDPESNTLTVPDLKIGSNTMTVTVPGYQTVQLTIEVKKALEKVDLTADTITKGQDLVISSTSADFLENLKIVEITAPNGASRYVYREGNETPGIGYTVDLEDRTLTIGQALFNEDFAQKDGAFQVGEYTLTITGEYYGRKTVKVTVNEDITKPGPEEPETQKDAPKPNRVRMHYEDCVVEFAPAVQEYLETVTGVSVNGTAYKVAVMPLSISEGEYFINSSAAFVTIGGDVAKNAFVRDLTTVVMSAKGYKDLTFKVKDGKLVDSGEIIPPVPGPETKPDTPVVKDAPTVDQIKNVELFLDNYDRVSFKEKDVATYLSAVTKIMVGNVEAKKGNSLTAQSYKISKNDFAESAYIDFSADCFAVSEETTVVITAEGYKDLTFKVKDRKLVTGEVTPQPQPEPEEPDHGGETAQTVAPTVKTIKETGSAWLGTYYQVTFADDADAAAYLKEVTAVFADNQRLEKTTTMYSVHKSYKFSNNEAFGGPVCFLDITKDCLGKTITLKADGYADLTFTLVTK